MSRSNNKPTVMHQVIPEDRSIHFSQKDFVEVWDKMFDILGPHLSSVYVYDSGTELELTYSDIKVLMMEFIEEMGSYGFVAGDRIAITGPPSPHYLFLSYAFSYMGVTCALIDNSLPIDEIEKLIVVADPCAIFASSQVISSFSEGFKDGRAIFQIDKNGKLAELIPGSPEAIVTHTSDPDLDVMLILFSSGTTGKMKGAQLTYHSILRGLEIDSKICNLQNKVVGSIVFFYVLPINHVAGYMSATTAFINGAVLKFLENVTPLRYLEGLKRFQPTHFLTVPAVYDIMEQKAFETIRQKGSFVYWLFKSMFRASGFIRRSTGYKTGRKLFKFIYSKFLGENITTIVTGASPCKDSTTKFFVNMGLEWINFYATTETNIPICAVWAQDREKHGYSGYSNAVDIIEIRIANTDDQGIGEIQVKSDLVMKGYFRDPDATKEAFDGEWFRTGDRGYIDNRKKLHIVGRIKESIVLRTGKKVSSHDVDDYYNKATDNRYALACCGIPTEEGWEDIHLFVERGEFSEHGQADIKKTLMDVSAKAASMYHIADVHFVDHIPKTSVGKIKRFALRDQLNVPKTQIKINCNGEEKSEDSLCAMIRKYKPDAEIHSSSKLVEDLGLDSITLFNIKCDIESRYNLDFGGAFGAAETVGDLWNMMNGEVPDIDDTTMDLSMYPSPRNAETAKNLRKWTWRFSIPYRFEVKGQENIPSDGSNYIVCGNHASFLDPLWILNAAGGRIDYSRVAGMAAKERMDTKFERKLFDSFGAIPVDRFGNTLPATQRAKECLTDEKYIMFIFPEGARSRDGSMLPFKTGAADLSIQTGRKILPVRIEGSFQIFPRHKKYPKFFRLGRRRLIRVTFGKPMNPEDYSDPKEMTQILKETISRL